MSKNKNVPKHQVIDRIVEVVMDFHPDDLETDDNGQVIVYTGIYRKDKNTYHEKK